MRCSLFVQHFWLVLLLSLKVLAQNDTTTAVETPEPSTTEGPISTTSGVTTTSRPTTTKTTSSSAFDPSAPPDVYLNVPSLSVKRIELVVEKLAADINLNAKVAQLVNINAGVQVSVETVNITIADVKAELELTVRLGHLVDIVSRVFESIDLNPLLVNVINGVTDLLDDVVGVVDGLLGSITQGGKTLDFIIDNLGNIVQRVTEDGKNPVSTIVGDYLTNMTFTGEQKNLANGLIQKTYEYSPLNALVNVVTNTLGQVVQAVVVKKNGGGGGGGNGGGSTTSTTASATATPTTTPSSTASAAPSAEPTEEARRRIRR